MSSPSRKEPRREPGRQKLLAILKYGLFAFVSNLTGSIFWWAEQRKWKLADQLEQQKATRCLEKKIEPAEAMRQLSGGRNGANPQIIATYDYTDEEGKLLFQCVRVEPKDFRQRRPDDSAGWIWNMQGVRRLLYRLPDVLKGETICVAEGEKDCDNLAKLGFVATTNPLGAGKWLDEHSETLRGKAVIIFGDTGDPDHKGERHTKQVIQSLTGKAKVLKHVRLPDGFHDVSDYIKSFPSADEAKTAIETLIRKPRAGDLSDISDRSELTPGLKSLKSLKSQPCDDHPAPLSPAAYHGLAGAFVQRVLPETEADPAALLIQFLAAFGNAYQPQSACSSRWFMAWPKHLRHNCRSDIKKQETHIMDTRLSRFRACRWGVGDKTATGGLSSGEGLIWNVRDPILLTVKGVNAGRR